MRTSLAEQYLYDGERLLCSITKISLFNGHEELAATSSRIIHVRRGSYFDISYGHLLSVSIGRTIEWKWGKWAVTLLFIALLCIGASMFLPVIVSGSANAVSGQMNTLTHQLMGNIVPQGHLNMSGQTLGYDTSLSSIDLSSSADANAGLSDLGDPADTISAMIAGLFWALGLLAFAVAVAFLAILGLTVRRGIIMRMPGNVHSFFYGGYQEKQSKEFIEAVVGKINEG